MERKTAGALYGFIGMLSFSVTLPATRAAVLHLDSSIIAFGRPVIAAVVGGIALLAAGARFPERRYWAPYALVVLGGTLGVPYTYAWAMHALPASHGAIVLALLPLATALLAALRAREHPSRRFWWASLAGSAAVLTYALMAGAGTLRAGDLILLLSLVASALQYADGARLSRVIPAWQVISWSAVLGLPFNLVPLAVALKHHPPSAPASAWIAFAYIGIVSQLAGVIIWAKGMALAGIARIGQLQLLQPFFMLLFSWMLLGERITVWTVITAVVVVSAVAIGRNAAIHIRSSSALDRPSGDRQLHRDSYVEG